MSELSPPLKWHGGKAAFNGKLAKWIISLMPPHKHYIEPYFGGGAVLLHKDPEGVSEVVNDIHNGLMNFWNVIKCDGTFDEFARKVNLTPFSEMAFVESEHGTTHSGLIGIGAAVRFFIRARQSRQGLMKDFATLSRNRTRRGMNEQVSSWLTGIEGLPDVHNRLKRVVILNRPALEVIKQQDGPDTCFYLDPPYLHETRSTTKDYKYEMSVADHHQLLLTLTQLKGKFLLSGYHSEMYDYMAEDMEWKCHECDIVNNASSKAVKDKKTECVWTNY